MLIEPNTLDVMIDLETLGTAPGSVVLSIGAVTFGANGLGAQFYREIDLESSAEAGLAQDADTIAWWLNTNKEEFMRLTRREPSEHKARLRAVSESFNAWLVQLVVGQTDKLRIWGNGANFDNVLWREAANAAGVPPVWVYWQDRCYRTIKSLSPSVKLIRQGMHHNALDDAKSQAEHLVRILYA